MLIERCQIQWGTYCVILMYKTLAKLINLYCQKADQRLSEARKRGKHKLHVDMENL